MPNSTNPQTPPTKVIGTRQPDVSYTDRHAVRVIALDAAGSMALVYVQKGSYYKLPGGGVEGAEDHTVAAVREVQEETGAVVAVRPGDGCVASTEEFRADLHQISYAYVADVVEAVGRPTLTEEEVADGLSHEWVPVHEALEKMNGAQPTSELGRFIRERDVYLLGQAAEKLGIL